MKQLQLGSWLVLFILALQFTSCDNEPLEGDFPQEQEIGADPGQFVAVINGQGFVAESVTAVFDENNTLVISGIKASTGESITLTVENASVGAFDISAGLGNLNSGIYITSEAILNPYTTAAVFGGSGTLEITEINTDSLTVTGRFSMEGVRQALDAEGNPVEDGDGNPVIENISITNGSFNMVPYTESDTGGGGGGSGPVDPFFALVDGVPFQGASVNSERTDVAGVTMIQIRALNAIGQLLRIDIPEDIGTGTFEMVQISDGTKLIGFYNPMTGGEDLSSNPGTITITEFNTLVGRIAAEFTFVATDPLGQDPSVYDVTEGSFDIRYDAAATSATNTMIADVDGVSWAANFVDAFEFDFQSVATVTARGYNSESGESIEITFPKDLAPGSYDFVSEATPGESIAHFIPVVGGDNFTSTDGSIIVLTNDLESGGIFEAGFLFLGEDLNGGSTDTFSLTNGLFTIEL